MSLLLLFACGPEPVDEPVDQDGDGYSVGTDCDDGDEHVHPDTLELCDGVDNDCDGGVDLGAIDAVAVYADEDADGFGDEATETFACAAGDGQVLIATDCDDAALAVHPDATEICNAADDDCDGAVDDDDPGVDLSTAGTWYADLDGDGFGAGEGVLACVAPLDRIPDATDCDDLDVQVNPAATEICNGIDDDCDGASDDADADLDLSTATETWADADGDGFGEPGTNTRACAPEATRVENEWDCDDTNAAVHPDATEVCNAYDDDCDTGIDDADAGLDLSTATVWWADSDGDGAGDAAAPEYACVMPSGASADATDCDDAEPAVNPSAVEVCNTIDDDCDVAVDDADTSLDVSTASTWYADVDADNYGDASSTFVACVAPSSTVSDATDCDDTDASVNPAGAEVCNDADDDCDVAVDDADASLDATTASTWFEDTDADGYGDAAVSVTACDMPAGYASLDDDCSLADATVYPGAREVCEDGTDQNCDGSDRACGGWYGEIDPEAEYETAVYSTGTSATFGSAHVVLDWNGDGQDDVAIGASQSDLGVSNGGAVFVYEGPLVAGAWADTSNTTAIILGESGSAYFGGNLYPLGDLDGDGDGELYSTTSSSTSATGQRGVFLGGSASGTVNASDVVAFSQRCWGQAEAGDPDGDGVGGWVCGDTDNLDWFEGLATTPSMTITGIANSYFGGHPRVTRDIDGDGVADMWIAATAENPNGANSGSVYAFSGPFASMDYTDADASVSGTVSYGSLGTSTELADVDGDGDLDYLAGAARDESGSYAGALYAWYTPISGALAPSDADVVWTTTDTDASCADNNPSVADLDGDGTDDVVLSYHGADGGGASRGEVWMMYGPFAGTYDVADAPTDGAHMAGAEDSDWLGAQSGLGSDLNGNGVDELVVGSHGVDWSGTLTSGAWYMFDLD